MYGIAVALCVCGLLIACQSTKGASVNAAVTEKGPIVSGMSIIQTNVLGFSPTAETGSTAITFALYFANSADIKKWTIAVIDAKGKKSKELSGNNLFLPSDITWDGKNSSGKYAAEGTYVATLTVNYGNTFPESVAKSTPFILDTTRPSGTISFTPPYFSPMSDGDQVSFTITPDKDLARIDSWGMEIFDPAWNLFMAYHKKWPTNTVSWDGRGLNGDLVVSAEDYPVVVKLRDEFGNVGIIETFIPVDIIVIKDGDNYRIENSRVYFKDFTANYENVSETLSHQNILRLDQLAEKLKKYPDHKITIVGHAVMLHWDDPVLGKIEQDEVLVPLSKARAEAIKKAIVTRGVNSDSITTEGAGAADPLVPDSDYANRWKNRRTAIYLVK
jgi:hypothetical protein